LEGIGLATGEGKGWQREGEGGTWDCTKYVFTTHYKRLVTGAKKRVLTF